MSVPNRMKAMPNIVNLCIDAYKNGELTGRMYDRYHAEASPFQTIVEAMQQMEKLFDAIRYPQSTVHARQFVPGTETERMEKKEEKQSAETVLSQKGKGATLVVAVTGRQNASWQGRVYWQEADIVKEFSSAVELLSLVDAALEK